MVQTRDTAHGFYSVDLQPYRYWRRLWVKNNYRYSVQQVAHPRHGYKAAAKVQLLIQIAAFFQSNYLGNKYRLVPLIYRDKTISGTPKNYNY